MVIVGSVIVLTLFTALIAPFFIDWSSYRSAFEQQASRILGQRVEVLGKTKVRLLPLPFVSFENISVGQNPDKSAMLSADQFSMDIELMPLLSGEVRIVEMHLMRPSLNLLVDKNGEVEWTNPRSLPVDPGQVALEKLKISNGEIRVNGLAAAENLFVEQIDATISAQTLLGPWQAEGEGFVGDTRTRFGFSTGRYQDAGQIRVRLDLDSDALPYELLADGQMRLVDELVDWAGEFSILPVRNTAGKEALPVRVEGVFNASPKRIEISEYLLDIGAAEDPYTVKGAGYIDIAQHVSFSVVAKGRQVDVDRILGSKRGQTEAKEEPVEANSTTLSERLEFAKNILKQVPVPAIDGRIELDLPAIVAGDTTMRQITAVISPQDNKWRLDRASATLPGNTKLELSGLVHGSPFSFDGDALIASRQPTGLASWLGSGDSQFVRKLKAAGFSGKLKVDEKRVSVKDLELVLDENILNGRLERIQSNTGQNRLVANLSGKTIDVDELRALYAVLDQENDENLASHDLDIELKADELLVDGLQAFGVDTKFTVKGGSFSLERLNTQDAFGAKVRSSGRVENLLSAPSGDFKLRVEAAQPGRLFDVLKDRFPELSKRLAIVDTPELATDLIADFTIKAATLQGTDQSRGNATLNGEVGGSQFALDGEFEGNFATSDFSRFDISWRVENTAGANLLRQLGVPVSNGAIGPNNLQLAGKLNGDLGEGTDILVTALSDNSSFSAKGKIGFASQLAARSFVKSGELQINVASKNLPEIAELMDGGNYLNHRGLLAERGYFEGGAKFDEIELWNIKGSGELGATSYEVDLSSKQVAGNFSGFGGKVRAGAVSLEAISALIVPTANGKNQEGESGKWSELQFEDSPLDGLNTKLEFQLDELKARGKTAASDVSFEFAMNERGAFVNAFTASALGGSVGANLSVTNKLGVGALSAQFSLQDANASDFANLLDQKFDFSGRINVNGSIDGAGSSAKNMIAGLSGSGTVEISDGAINSFNANPLPELFAAVDVEGFKIDDETIEPLLQQNFFNGRIKLGKVTAPYLIAAGKLTARNIEASLKGVRAKAQYELDLQNMQGELQYSVGYDPGSEWVDGVEPEVSGVVLKGANTKDHVLDVQGLSGFLSLRRFEQEQRKVDLLQASIMEKQRLRTDVLLTNARIKYRKQVAERAERRRRQALLRKMEDRLRREAAQRHLVLLNQERHAQEEAERKAREEAERKRKQEEARLAAIEAERLRKLEEERLRKQEEARLEAEEKRKQEAALEAAEEARLAQEEKDRAAAQAAKKEEARQASETAVQNSPTLLDLFSNRRKQQENQQLPADFGKRLNDFLNER